MIRISKDEKVTILKSVYQNITDDLGGCDNLTFNETHLIISGDEVLEDNSVLRLNISDLGMHQNKVKVGVKVSLTLISPKGLTLNHLSAQTSYEEVNITEVTSSLKQIIFKMAETA